MLSRAYLLAKLSYIIISLEAIYITIVSKEIISHTKYRWHLEKNVQAQGISIRPLVGFTSSYSDIMFNVRYAPKELNCLFKTTAKCLIESINKTLELVLTGTCVPVPHPVATIDFKCPVRTSIQKEIPIKNPTDTVWRTFPMVSGNYFKASEAVTIQPKSTANCTITYRPIAMKPQPNIANVTLKLPNGKTFVYNLMGIPETPVCVEKIVQKIQCKTTHIEPLIITNWMDLPQQFKIITENTVNQSVGARATYRLEGNDIIDVPPLSDRTYKWKIYVIKEGYLEFKITFRNVKTNEYVFYEIALTVTKCPPLAEFSLSTCVRQPIIHTIKVNNPIKTAVNFQSKCATRDFTYENTFTIEPLSQYDFNITYCPILIGEKEVDFDLVTDQLGSFPYKFHLIAQDPIPEPTLHLTATLGQTVSARLTIFNKSMTVAGFTQEVEHSDVLFVQGLDTIPANNKANFDIVFKPRSIMEIYTNLKLDSTAAGLFIYPIIAKSLPPKPQGPYFLKPEQKITISFKNPFNETKTFRFSIEPSVFLIQLSELTLEPDQEMLIDVQMQLNNLEVIEGKYVFSGKLTISCSDCDVRWIYYLQGDV